ncbi:hypothetical protein [Pedosphaera parvula]|uniref:Glycosyltransferase RgtA/B/C/D-like domain-containing protein n=1 Tax=Pedosphaera parvula (strain Ellin514) TaxID=320771 RepID=B9XED6_PEDPL|nr:hypothetical protein [Pedosphaera parvula]EEF61650.1 conserved hypothetical protein [Pedosphaera parvula Ellin514]
MSSSFTNPITAEAPARAELKPATSPQPKLTRHLQSHIGWVMSLFLVGLGVKLGLICRFATSLPFFDQWGAEAGRLYSPYFQGHIPFENWFKAHNEHRLFFTRIYDFALLLLNGQWDSRLQMAGNALIHCGAIAGLGWLLAHLMGKKTWPYIWLPLALALVLPFAWENTLAGFQSQFYFLMLFSMLTIWLLSLSEPLSRRWWLGVAAAIASLFTTAAGMLACAAVAALVVLEILKVRRIQRRHVLTLAVCFAIGIAGLLLKKDVPSTAVLKANSLHFFFMALGRNFTWPRIWLFDESTWHLLPLFVLGWMYFRSSRKDAAADRMILGMGVWVILQCLATAYARGVNGSAPASRYMDSNSFIMIAGALSIIRLLTAYRQTMWFTTLFAVVTISYIWIKLFAGGLWELSVAGWNHDIPERVYSQRMWLKTTRAFLATDDLHALQGKRFMEIAYPDPEKLATFLRDPHVRRILPTCVRESLKVSQIEMGDHPFLQMTNAANLTDTPAGPYWISPALGTSGKFESLPIAPGALPYLEIPVAGYLAAPGASLELLDLSTSRIIRVQPPRTGAENWQSVFVKAPAGKFKILATSSPDNWFAFKEPRELGRFSYWTMLLLGAWKWVLWLGLGCLVLNLLLLMLPRRLDSSATNQDRLQAPAP